MTDYLTEAIESARAVAHGVVDLAVAAEFARHLFVRSRTHPRRADFLAYVRGALSDEALIRVGAALPLEVKELIGGGLVVTIRAAYGGKPVTIHGFDGTDILARLPNASAPWHSSPLQRLEQVRPAMERDLRAAFFAERGLTPPEYGEPGVLTTEESQLYIDEVIIRAQDEGGRLAAHLKGEMALPAFLHEINTDRPASTGRLP